AGVGYALSFHATLAFLSISAWYWARALLSARFDVEDTDRGLELLAKEDPRVRPLPFEAVPRLMFVASLLLGVGLVFRSGLWIHLVYLTLWGVPFLLLVVFRRQLRDRVRQDLGRAGNAAETAALGPGARSTIAIGEWVGSVPQRFRTLLRRAPWSRWVALVVIVFAFGVFLYGVVESFVVWGPGHAGLPALVATWFPGPAAALLGFALMMAPLSTLTFVSDGWRIRVNAWGLDLGLRRPPIIWLLVGWVVIASAVFSIYTVRIVPDPGGGTQITQRADLADFFKAWVDACAPTGTIRPVVVAVSGGASRAAIWGERVLYQVEHSSDKTRPVVFAVSSVSGGSLGAAAYMTTLAALPPEQRCGEDRLSPARSAALEALKSPRLAQDALGPLLAGALLVDIPRAIFSPFAWVARWISNTQPRGGDRAEALERAFERLWRRLPVPPVDSGGPGDKRSFSQPFLSLFYDAQAIRPGMPIWIANGTSLETGSRLLTAPFDPRKSWPFNDAADALSALNADVRISTAINNGARFAFLEPAGELLRYPIDQKSRPEVIDGGYFDNEGLLTALELVQWIQARGPSLAPGRTIEPILVQATADSIVGVTADQIVRCGSPSDDPTKASNARRPVELLTPFLGLYKVLGAHSQVLLREAREKHCPNAFFHFYLPARDGKRVPLNWILSQGTAQYIWDAMDTPLTSGNLDE
ncbi:MAG TPA: hypothetical protein VH278_06735, partial [Burkholderiaceae bacterium]|nr:hypothetical protein [Burkholderiaceae bacterium]